MLIFRFTACEDRKPAVDLTVYLVIRVKAKNDIWLGPFSTDHAGRIALSRDTLDHELQEAIDLSLRPRHHRLPGGRSHRVRHTGVGRPESIRPRLGDGVLDDRGR